MEKAQKKLLAHAAAAMVVGLVALAWLPTAEANHIRVMVVSQSGANGNDVTLQVDFNYSGDCCGGTFHWNTGDGRDGYLSDGISNGLYQNDGSGTGTLSNGDPFSWHRFRPDPNVALVRIQITYSYRQAGTYRVTWDDCCPYSSGTTAGTGAVVVTGAPTTLKILALQTTTSNALVTAFMNAAIPQCSGTPPLCYELVSPALFATMTLAQLSAYKVIMVGSDSDAAVISALVVQTPKLLSWTVSGGGLVAYAQWNTAITGQWSWVPNLGGSAVQAVASAGDDVTMTAKGQAHLTHLTQSSNGVNTLSNWHNSRENYFTSWPGYFDNPVAGPLSVDGNGHAISLAGLANSGCVFITGQPVDLRAAAGVASAQQLFRSTINYGVNCV